MMIATQPAAHHDPIARLAWICLLILAVWINVASYQPPALAQGADPGTIILQATLTPALPTPALPTPALPTPAPTLAPDPLPDQIDDAAPAPAPAPLSAPIDNSGGMITDTAPPPAVDTPTDVQPEINDPLQNGGNIAPEGCPFPIINGRCANGVLAKTVPDEQVFGSKSIADPGIDPGHEEKARP